MEKPARKRIKKGEFVRLAYVYSSGKTGEDMISVEKALKSLLEGKEFEGSYNYYDGCDVRRGMILHYSNKKVPVHSPLRKKGEIRILKGGIFYTS